MHRHSTINTKSLACDISGLWQTEKADCSCHFIGRTKPSQWGIIQHKLALLLCDNRSKLCRYKPWSDGISGDIPTCHLAGCTQSQGDDSGFRCTVVSLSSG